MDLAL